jgi:hypothetical protein
LDFSFLFQDKQKDSFWQGYSFPDFPVFCFSNLDADGEPNFLSLIEEMALEKALTLENPHSPP